MSPLTPMVDPSAIAEQLAAVQAARERLDRVERWLEDGLEIFAGPAAPAELPPPADDEQRGEAPPEPVEPEPETVATPRQPSARRGARDLRAKALHAVIGANRPVAFAEIHAVVGGSVNSLREVLQQLVRDGQVDATGATKARRYAKGDHAPHTERRARVDAAQKRNAAKVDDGIARVVFRDKVAKAIAGDDGCLNQERLTLALNADRDDVAEACAWLVEHRRITANPDGTYSRHVTGRARLRAA